MKNKVVDLLIVGLVYIFFSSFPYNYFIEDLNLLLFIQSLSKLVAAIFIVIFSIKSKNLLTPKNKGNFLLTMLLIPTFAMVFNNLIFSSVVGSTPKEGFDGINLLANVTFIFITALTEEYIFRYLLLNNLPMEDKLTRILLGAVIFGLFHIITFLSTFNPYDLIQIVYTTGLGIVLGFFYLYGKTLYVPVIFHFLFNFFNSYMFSLYNVPSNDVAYFSVATLDAVVVLGYIAILYFGLFRKYDKFLD